MVGKILFAAGGTMGHVGPAIAVADLLSQRNPDTEIQFVGTRGGIEQRLNTAFRWRFIAKAPLPRSLSLPSLLFPFTFSFALFQSLRLVRQFEVVVGFGGYVATPIYIAAKLLGRPIVIHEANALAGFANRLGRKWAKSTFVNFDSLGLAWQVETIGIPLRKEIVELALRYRQSTSGDKASRPGRNRILVLGGSRGSASINQVIWDSLDFLKEKYMIRQSVGVGNLGKGSSSETSYRAEEFIDDMAAAYDEAEIVIARAGAVTCAEIRELGKRAILIPLGHGNGEQRLNAAELVECGNALAVSDREFTSQWLIDHLDQVSELEPKLPSRPLLQADEIMAAQIEIIMGEKRKS